MVPRSRCGGVDRNHTCQGNEGTGQALEDGEKQWWSGQNIQQHETEITRKDIYVSSMLLLPRTHCVRLQCLDLMTVTITKAVQLKTRRILLERTSTCRQCYSFHARIAFAFNVLI
jgi:hypothetical protein